MTSQTRSSMSLVWNYFDIHEDATKAMCKECRKLVSRGGKDGKTFNTSNLKKHLQVNHKNKYDEMTNKEMKNKEEQIRIQEKRKSEGCLQGIIKKRSIQSDNSNEVQLTIAETYTRKDRWDINSPQSQSIHKAIGEMIAVDCQPYSIVEDVGFNRLMKLLKPNYVVPGRKYFSKNIIPEIHSKIMNELKSVLENAANISFTTDIWTNNSNASFISLTAHCITDDFERKVVVLRVVPFEGPHTASNITEIIEITIQEFKIPNNKVHIIVHDNGKNIVRAIQDTNYASLSCFLHTLQLVVNDSIFEQRIIKDIIANCKQIVGHFSHSALAYQKLRDLQKQHGLPEHKLIPDVSTRWNSTYFMIERLAEQKMAIANYCLDIPNLPTFDANKWNLIGKLTAILKIFHQITVRLSDRYSLISEIIPQVTFLQIFAEKALNDQRFSGTGSTLLSIKESIQTRMLRYLDSNNTILATYLDPRYKNSLFQNISDENSKMYKNNLEQSLVQAVEDIKKNESMEDTDTSSAGEEHNELEESKITTPSEIDLSDFEFNACLDQLVAIEKQKKPREDRKLSKKKSLTTLTLIKNEIIKYEMLDIQQRDGNPLQWWKVQRNALPNLSLLANKYLCSPPSSVESERLFSTGGNIYTPHRNRLNPENGEMLMFLAFNLRVFNFKY